MPHHFLTIGSLFTHSFPFHHVGTTSLHHSTQGRHLASSFFFFFNNLSLYLSALGLHCCAGFFLVAVRKLLLAVASLVAERRL